MKTKALIMLLICVLLPNGGEVLTAGRISSNPNAGTIVPLGSEVDLVCSLAATTATEPNVPGCIVSWGEQRFDGRDFKDAQFTAVAAGRFHSLALKSDGSIVGWGDDDYGQASPPSGTDFVAVAAGCYHSLALKADGSIVGWGDDYSGQASPPSGTDFVAVAAGCYHSLALKADGSIVGWGKDYSGQASPPSGTDFVAVAAGGHHSLALKADGSIVGWGWDGFDQASPPAGTDFVAVAAGGLHSLALKADGSIVGWGWDYDGQASPPSGTDFVAVAAGGEHSLALKADGSIVGWGWDCYGQASPPSGTDFVAVAAGSYHSLALKADGSIVGWGDNYYGQATPPAGNDFVAIAAGWEHSLAIVRTDEPDLELTSEDITFAPVPGEPCTLVTIEAEIWNAGEIEAQDVLVVFKDFDQIIGSQVIPIIEPNDTNTVSIQYTWPEASFRLITIEVDPNNTISESDENNNTASKVYQIGEISGIDTNDMLGDLFLNSGDIQPTNPNPQTGENIAIQAIVHARRDNYSNISDVPLSFYARHESGNSYKIGYTQYIDVIEPDSSESASVDWMPTADGFYVIDVNLEPGFSDRCRYNNQASRSLFVGDLPFDASFIVQKRKRKGRTRFEYACKIALKNNSSLDLTNVAFEVTQAKDSVAVVDAYVRDFDDIAAEGTVVSHDRCIIRVNRAEQIDEAQLQWKVTYEIVNTCETLQQDSESALNLSSGIGNSRRPYR